MIIFVTAKLKDKSTNQLFCADDSRIRKITCSVPKAVDSADFKLFFSLFSHHRLFNDLSLTDLRTIHRTGFTNIQPITLQPLFGIQYAELFKA